jgi:hypothetical protein
MCFQMKQTHRLQSETKHMKMLLTTCSLCVLLVSAAWAQGQGTTSPLSDTDIKLLREDLAADKNHIIADTMQFTNAESTVFWPVYENYAHDQKAIGDDYVQLVKDYAKNYDSMNDANAKDMVQRMINIEDRALNLREDYWPKFEKALGAKRAAKFYQVDNRLNLMLRLQLASEIPLIP